MATRTIKTDALPQLATLPERVSVLETKVENNYEKLVELKADVKEMHDCLDRTREGIMEELAKMHKASCDQHTELAGKVRDLQKFKDKWMTYAVVALAFLGGAGWFNSVSFPHLIKLLGL